ncbi:MAG TPA: cytochrome P450 [Longimicrobiaceae bacterium]|nr:cytochrome P450 [Longimicrobiaceae bacterium]
MSIETAVAACPITLHALVEGHTDPHGLYDALREQERVSWDATGRCWLVTGHGAVRKLLADPRFVSDGTLVNPQPRRPARRSFLSDAIQKQILFVDGEKQARMQKAVLVELARRGESLAGPLRASALELAEAARARGELDLVRGFAIPYSLRAISLILGLPPLAVDEVERLERQSTIYADVTSGHLRMEMDEILALGEYFQARVAERGGVPGDDLIGAFMRDAGLDDADEVAIQAMMAFAAGRVTTQKLLASGLALLLDGWAGWRAAVLGSPTTLRKLTDELLRVVTPTRYVVRYATEDVTLDLGDGDAATLRRGEKVVFFLEAANRDPAAFACPHAVQAERAPNPHLAFGFGAHRCPGASVARIEIQTALQALFETFAELRPHPGSPPEWDPNPNLGGYASYRCICA